MEKIRTLPKTKMEWLLVLLGSSKAAEGDDLNN